MIKADEALRIGLVNRVVEADKLMDGLRIWLKPLRNAPIAVKLSKALLIEVCNVIYTAIMYEAEAFGECFSQQIKKRE